MKTPSCTQFTAGKNPTSAQLNSGEANFIGQGKKKIQADAQPGIMGRCGIGDKVR